MKYLLIFLYVAISILVFFLNWELFTTVLVIDLGFGEFNTLPFVVLQVFGGIILGVFAVVDGIKDLQRIVKISELEKKILTLQKDAEIATLKNAGSIRNTGNVVNSENPIPSKKTGL